MTALNLEEERLLQQELGPGETVVWSGNPSPSVIFHTQDFFLIPFSFMWGGFAIFWEFGASKGGAFFELWGLPFIVIGQYMIWGRFIYAAWKKRRVLYVLTKERALVLVRPPQAKTITASLRQLGSVEKSVRSDGKGTITFGTPPSFFGSRNQQNYDGLKLNFGVPVFVDIEDVAEVFNMVERLRSASHAQSHP